MEIWKDIIGYEGLYQISNKGRVKSLKKWCGNKHLSKWIKEESILKPTDNGNGYLIIGLRNQTKRKNFYIHRLVASYFLDNPENKKCINHKDFNKQNNDVDNLEWISQKDNVLYSVDRMKHRKSRSKTNTGERYITKRYKKYRVQIDYKDLGLFETLEEAKAKRDQYLKENPQ